MEARVRVLETHIDYIKDGVAELQGTLETVRTDTSALKVGMATLTERMTDTSALKVDMATVKVDMTTLRVDMTTLKVDVATLKERMAHLPGKGFIVTAAAGGVAAVVALLTLLSRFGFLVAR